MVLYLFVKGQRNRPSGSEPERGEMTQREELEDRKDWQVELYQRYHQKVFGICLYFLKDREEAKDASHDVFLKVFRGLGRIRMEVRPDDLDRGHRQA